MRCAWRCATVTFVLLLVGAGLAGTATALGTVARAARQVSSVHSAAPLFKLPSGVALDRQGNVYVIDDTLDRLVKLSPKGKVLARWGRKGSGSGEFNAPNDVAVGQDGTIYVADGQNNRVEKMSPSGKVLATWDITFSRLTLDSHGNIWGAAGGGVGSSPDVVELSPAGKHLAAWQAPKSQATTTNEGIAVDPRGFVYLSDEYFNRVDKFSLNGKLLRSWGKQGQNVGQLDSPEGLALDAQGNVYVADRGNSRVQKFSSAGKSLKTFGDFFSLGLPEAVAVDKHGNVYVAAGGIYIYSPAGKQIAHWR